MKIRRLKFKNGWDLDIHEVRDGQVYYREWRPGVQHQPIIQGLCRMDVAEFTAKVNEERARESC